ncbi:MAG: DinB family protein [Fimbriimonas sp.]
METWIAGFDYDRWANEAWFTCLEAKGWSEPDRSIFEHILAAQEIWLMRVGGTSPAEMPKPELSLATMDRLHHGWRNALKNAQGDPLITFRRTTGEAIQTRLGDIARHVVNHGTYHRGELRGLCRGRGDEDLPETDFSRYVHTH